MQTGNLSTGDGGDITLTEKQAGGNITEITGTTALTLDFDELLKLAKENSLGEETLQKIAELECAIQHKDEKATTNVLQYLLETAQNIVVPWLTKTMIG